MLPAIKVITALITLTLISAAGGNAQGSALADSIRDTLSLARSLRPKERQQPAAGARSRASASAAASIFKEPVSKGCAELFRVKRYGKYDRIIASAASRYGFKDSFVKAVIRVESDFDRWAVSHAGAMGLMQLMPETASDVGVRDPFDPAQNIEGGTAYLRYLMNRYGDARLALLAYYGGPGLVDRGIIPRNGIRYLKKVLRYYRYYQSDCASPLSSS